MAVPRAVAAPANDDFADAQKIGPTLPISLTESNEGATKEEGEPVHAEFGSKGHSVWFKWEATSTGFVTVGTCGSDFRTVVSVYTGTKVDELTKVAGDHASEGPDCPSYDGREVTFKTHAGTTYEIAVDGEAYYLPPAEPPIGEGTFVLQVRATPAPPNDDFADASPLAGEIQEDPGGHRIYSASAHGYNWGATTEAGEPTHGSGAGASVWYRWTVPEDGKYRFNGPCCNSGLSWDLYAGSGLGELVSILPGTWFAEAVLSAGKTYWISVYGAPDLQTGEPSMGLVNFLVFAELPPHRSETSGSSGGAGDSVGSVDGPASGSVALPNTLLYKHALKRRPPIFVFHFGSTEPGSTFRCKVDRHPWRRCGSGMTFTRPGRHVLRVAAVDPSGNVDPTPVVARFRIAPIRR